MWWKRRTYLDSAAGMCGNPASPHEEGRRAKSQLEDARTSIARLIEVQADDVLFTSGATESNALAILGYARALRARAGADTPGRNNMHVLYLPSAHASVVENVALLAEEGIATEPLPLSGTCVDTDALAKMLRPETVLVTMDAVCGETGVVWNTREVAEVLRRRGSIIAGTGSARAARPIQLPAPATLSPLLHVDASQAPWTEKITRAHFGADLLTLDGAKVGVRGIGALIAHRTIPLLPLYRGGGQERGLRPGSEDPERAREFAACLRQAAQGRERFVRAARGARAALLQALTPIPGLLVNEAVGTASAPQSQAPNILNVSLPGRDTDYLVALLDEAGFSVSTRSACETDSTEGSRAVQALYLDSARARATIRISWGPSVSTRALLRCAQALKGAVAFVDRQSGG